ncbi:MAG TPA: hypothetical protein VF185_04765 [Patescibacteria group bacterium]
MGFFNKQKDKHQALKALGLAILQLSFECGQQFKVDVDEKFGKDSKEAISHLIEVQYEFLFFFMHLTMRYAFGELGHEKRVKIQDFLSPTLQETTTKSWFGHWPDKYKEGIKNEFYRNMNNAELEYSKYKKMFADKNESPKDTLFWEFGKNIARLSGHENDPIVMMKCIALCVEELKQIKLRELVIATGKELD